MNKINFEKRVREFMTGFGGGFNAHAHVDRAFTYEDKYVERTGKSVHDLAGATLKVKQSLVWAIHQTPAFYEDLEVRMKRVCEESLEAGIRRIDSAIDVTYNTGMRNFAVAERVRAEMKGKLEFNIGAYNVSGFNNSKPERWKLFEEAAKRADFLVGLAEKDAKPGHIGEMQHTKRILSLAYELKKPAQFHVDQANLPDERGSEMLLDVMHWLFDVYYETKDYPEVWAVHAISPGCYEEERFSRLCERLVKYNVGVICCPSAAVSMKQAREKQTPVHNSIARVWDMALKGVKLRLGTDNINDFFVPSSTSDLYDELFILSHASRFYDERILARLACGIELDQFDRDTILQRLYPREES